MLEWKQWSIGDLITLNSERLSWPKSGLTGVGWLVSYPDRRCESGGPLHDRQLCWKLHEFLVHCPLLKSPHIVRSCGYSAIKWLSVLRAITKGERGQLSGKWFLAPQ